MKKITKDEYENRFFEKFKEKYIIVDNYINPETSVKIKHEKCGNIFYRTPYALLKGIGCPICNKKEQYNKLNTEEYSKKIYERYGDQYEVIEYIDAHSVIIKHNYFYDYSGKKVICNHIEQVDSQNLLKRKGKRTSCKYCRHHDNFVKIDTEMLNKSKFCVYMHKNTINNMIYIGITSAKLSNRWSMGRGYFNSSKFYNAIKKYGWDNFEHFLYYKTKWIKVNEFDNASNLYIYSFKDAQKLEINFIEKYRKKYGEENLYNITSGGEGIFGVNEKEVLQFTIDGIYLNSYSSITEASRELGISATGIGRCCNGKGSSAGGYLWKLNDGEPLKIPNKIILTGAAVSQYSQSGEFIKTFNSIADASKITGINKSMISGCCKNKYKMAGGYQWKILNSSKVINPILNYKFYLKKVYQYDLNGNFIKEYKSISEAKRKTGASSIWGCIKNYQATSGGYIWISDVNDLPKHLQLISNKVINNSKIVYQYDLNGNFIAKYNTVKECSIKNNINRNAIARCCDGKMLKCKNYIYLFENSNNKNELKLRIRNLSNHVYYNRKKVAKCDINTHKVIKIYDSIKSATLDCNLKSSSSIIACCNERTTSAGGYFWKYM